VPSASGTHTELSWEVMDDVNLGELHNNMIVEDC
jgi:hypothetical protein